MLNNTTTSHKSLYGQIFPLRSYSECLTEMLSSRGKTLRWCCAIQGGPDILGCDSLAYDEAVF